MKKKEILSQEDFNRKVSSIFNKEWDRCSSAIEIKKSYNAALEIIKKLKQQIHGMRNCDNCANSFYEDGSDDSCLVTVDMQNDCINNDRKHWRAR